MALAYLTATLTEKEYLANRYRQNIKTGKATQAALTNLKLFCKDIFEKELGDICQEMMMEIQKTQNVDIACVFLQKYVNWLAEDHPRLTLKVGKNGVRAVYRKDINTMRNYVAQMRLYLKKVGGIPLSSESLNDFGISYPDAVEKEEMEPLLKGELKRIIKAASPRRGLLYRITKDCEARIGAMVQLRKKHFNTNARPIEVTFPKHIMKKKNGVAYTNVKYVIQEDEEDLLSHLATLQDKDDLVFGTNENVITAVHNEEGVWHRLMERLKMDEKYSHNGRLKKNIHSIKSFTFTVAEEYVNETYANAYGDHSRYIRNYLRWTKEKKIEKFRAMEPGLALFGKYEMATDETLVSRNAALEGKIRERDELIEKLVREHKADTKTTPSPKMKETILEILREQNII